MLFQESAGEKLKRRVQLRADEELRDNPIFLAAKAGQVREHHIATYHFNLKYIMAQTPQHLQRAFEGSMARSEETCALSFKHRIPEEMGHDLWAAQDLANLKVSEALLTELRVLPSMQSLNIFITQMIERDPLNYAIYALWAEYFTVLVVPSFVSDLEAFCGISPLVMTVLTRHAEIDKDHVADDVVIIDACLKDRANYDFDAFAAIIDQATSFYRRFTNEILETNFESSSIRKVENTVSTSSRMA